ncbi:MAG TPA: hypothetical protein VKS22_00515 [Candidatus Binataceae bacterium]|nr:hypothetical protein [Candidatus Binataceae bacterium]
MVAEELTESFSHGARPACGCSESNHEAGDYACGVGAYQAITAALYAAFLEIPIKRYEIALKGYADLVGFYGVFEEPTGFERVVAK